MSNSPRLSLLGAVLLVLAFCWGWSLADDCGVHSNPVFETYALGEAVGDCPDPGELAFDWAVRDDGCLGTVPVPRFSFMRIDGSCFIPAGCDQPDAPCCTFYRPGGSQAPPFTCSEGGECSGFQQDTWIYGCPDPLPGELIVVGFRSL